MESNFPQEYVFSNLTVASFVGKYEISLADIPDSPPSSDPKPEKRNTRKRSRRKGGSSKNTSEKQPYPGKEIDSSKRTSVVSCYRQLDSEHGPTNPYKIFGDHQPASKCSVLIDREGMVRCLFPRPRSEIKNCFWTKVDKVYIHVAGCMDWHKPVPIRSQLILQQLFPEQRSVMIPLRDLNRVEHAWSILALSGDVVVNRLREELETAVSSVLGPAGCRVFPYRPQTEYKWRECFNHWQWCWLYMRYLGQDWNIPFLDIWTDPSLTVRRYPKYEWVRTELRMMPRVEEVMFICIPGFSPPVGTARLEPSILAWNEKHDHVPTIPAPHHAEWCDEVAKPYDKKKVKKMNVSTDLTHYPFIVSTTKPSV